MIVYSYLDVCFHAMMFSGVCPVMSSMCFMCLLAFAMFKHVHYHQCSTNDKLMKIHYSLLWQRRRCICRT